MLVPNGIPNCPRGLEYLTTLDQLLIEQKIHLLEIFTGFERQNKFKIRNNLGQQVSEHNLVLFSSFFSIIFIYSQFPIVAYYFLRFTGQKKNLTVALVKYAVQVVHLKWRFWILLKMKLFVFIVHWLVSFVVSRAVCNRLILQHQVNTWAPSNRNGPSSIQIFVWKIITTRLFSVLKENVVNADAALISISM